MADIITRLARRHTYNTLKSAMHGMTLNTIGKLYGVQREKGEDNRHYERRILKVACQRGPLSMCGKMVSDGIKEGIADAEKEGKRNDLGR